MKRSIIYILLITLLTLTGCQGSTSGDLSDKVDKLQNEINLLKSELEEVKKEKNEMQSEKEYAESQLEEIKEEEELKEDEVLVQVVNKTNIAKDTNNWIFSDSVNFHISIVNNSEKDIKGIQGLVDVQDMFGVSILKVACDLTGNTIKSGETFINKEMSLEINQFMDDHIKVYTTDFDDLNMIYTIKQIMFTDGTTKE